VIFIHDWIVCILCHCFVKSKYQAADEDEESTSLCQHVCVFAGDGGLSGGEIGECTRS